MRELLVEAIAAASPSFISLTGDIVHNGYDKDGWAVWDRETSAWRGKKIAVLPALGSHDLQGKETAALGSYFRRFPQLGASRYDSILVRE